MRFRVQGLGGLEIVVSFGLGFLGLGFVDSYKGAIWGFDNLRPE